MDFRNELANFRIGEIHKKYFVKASLADQFRRQCADVICGCHDEHLAFLLCHPRKEAAKHSLRRSGFSATPGKTLFDFIDPENARRHYIRSVQRLAKVSLCLAMIFVVHVCEVESQ